MKARRVLDVVQQLAGATLNMLTERIRIQPIVFDEATAERRASWQQMIEDAMWSG